MNRNEMSRRDVLKAGGTAFAGLRVMQISGPAQAFPGQIEQADAGRDHEAESEPAPPGGGQVIPWLDQPAPNPMPNVTGNLLAWEQLNSFYTPSDNFFFVQHYGQPDGLDESAWRLGVLGEPRHRVGVLHRRRRPRPLGRRAPRVSARRCGPDARREPRDLLGR